MPISYSDLENKDYQIETKLRGRYSREIDGFNQTAELIMSLFEKGNSFRTYRKDGRDCIHLISVRALQDLRSALILGLKGLYPQSSALIRGSLESVFIIYDFKLNPENEDIWNDGGKSKREKLFKASEVRNRIKSLKETEPAFHIYDLISDWSTHANRESYMWYEEINGGKLFYNWAGKYDEYRSDYIILSIISGLAQVLFVLAEEDIYTLKRGWYDKYISWKKDFLEVLKVLDNRLGINKLQNTFFQPYPVITLPENQ